MGQSSVRGEETRERVRHAGDPDRGGAPDGGDQAAEDASPAAAGGRGALRRRRQRERPRRRYRILRWVAACLALLILGTAGAGYLYYLHLNGNIKKDKLNLGDDSVAGTAPNAAGQTPMNILLIGSDARDTKANQDLGGARDTFGGTPLADVQMLVHLSADRSNMSVVSMPRDTLLEIPKCTDGEGKVYPASTRPVMTNESLGRGGPGCTVATWQKLTRIRIDHFMMVDFAGVVSMADAIGGVPVCVDANILSRDGEGHGSGLKLKKGTHPVKGEQALQWLRTRYGFEDGTDIGRAKAQHMYMNSMARELRENATLGNPGKLRGLAEQATSALTVDEGLDTVKKLYDLSNEFKRVPPSRITMTTMPWQQAVSDHNRVEPKPEDAEQLFRLVREDIALDGKDKRKSAAEKEKAEQEQAAKEPESTDPAAPDAQIAVRVQNGTGTATRAAASGRATQVGGLLAAEGFTAAAADGSAVPGVERTVLRYPSAELEGDARRVAKKLGIPADAVERSTAVSGVTLVVGADWREGDRYQAPEGGADGKGGGADDDRTPESADALNGSDKDACMHVDPNFTWS
ncbi:LCP family protein [Streptomyces physcomitrii]|uniref:LCP family protein n=1 Tax=Streptomyces physcomitrii TaxID=2724184 RepID=UPI00058F57EF